MDIATLLGLFIGVTVVTLAIMTGSDLSIFLNLPGFLIVCGGTFAATLIKFPLSGVFIAFSSVPRRRSSTKRKAPENRSRNRRVEIAIEISSFSG